MTTKVDGTNGVLQSYDYQVLTTGFSYTFAAGITNLIINPAGTLATGTITMPVSPADGMTITISSTQTITALTVNGNSGQSIVGAPTTLAAGGATTFVYRLSATTWYAQTNTAALGSAAISGGFSNMVVITSNNASYSIPATKIKITVVGGGGNGGSATMPCGACYTSTAPGGGGGGAAIKILSGLTIGSTLNVTIGGAGGTSSVASGTQSISTVSATGGTTGTNTNQTSAGTPGVAGGLGSGGDLNLRGGSSESSQSGTNPSGNGGSSILGAGGLGRSSGGVGNAGYLYGGGGGGAAATNGSTSFAGGAGAAGVVIIEY